MNVIEALRTMRDDMENKRIGVSYRMTLDQCISQLERAEADLCNYPPPYFTPTWAAKSALRQITGEKTCGK